MSERLWMILVFGVEMIVFAGMLISLRKENLARRAEQEYDYKNYHE